MPDLLILRHAQSTWNAEGRWQGQADPPLSPRGLEQARLAAGALRGGAGFEMVVSSDLRRARQTAEAVSGELGLGVAVAQEPDLREYDVAEWSGLTREEVERGWPGWYELFARGELESPPGGEERAGFAARVRRAWASIADRALSSGSGRVLVVTHAGVVRSIGRAAGFGERRPGPLSGYWGSVGEDGALHLHRPVDLLGDDRRPAVPPEVAGPR